MVTRKETEVCKQLKIWFNSYNIDCWMNEGDEKFITKKSQKKPDLIIFSKKLGQFIALEVKLGDIKKNVHDASKILEYYKEYVDGNIQYFINDKEITISSFAIATFYSMFGKLFQKDFLQKKEDIDEFNKYNKQKKIEPLNEYHDSRNETRMLWSQWRRFREKKELPGVGVIYNNDLNNEVPLGFIDAPILFDQQRETINGKRQWKVRQKWL